MEESESGAVLYTFDLRQVASVVTRVKVASVVLDCQTCGACCMNPRENEREGRRDYVPVEPSARLLARRDLVRKFVTDDAGGAPHLRMSVEGRCSALRGALGRKVGCEIYHLRPRACRTVQPGDGDCLRARREYASM